MSFEGDLFALLKAAAPALGSRVYPDFAPTSTPRPYCTWQQIGGDVINPIANDPPGVRLPEIQINVWANTKLEAASIARAIEDAMRAATAFSARPVGDFVGDFDADMAVYGTRQDFRCRHTT